MVKTKTKTMVLGAVLTALVFILQYLGSFIKLGPFSISLVLIPIVIGAATCGTAISTWLGFVFGAAVLLCGDAAPFLAAHVAGTIITVLAKGLLCGLCAGLAYKGIFNLTAKFSSGKKGNTFLSVAVAAIICPIVNTGVFLLGCLLFFMPVIAEWTLGAGLGQDVARYMIFVLVGANFLVEMLSNIILSPVATHIIKKY